jgi:hypothetical protein
VDALGLGLPTAPRGSTRVPRNWADFAPSKGTTSSGAGAFESRAADPKIYGFYTALGLDARAEHDFV